MEQMEKEIGDGYDDIGDDLDSDPSAPRERCESTAITDRVTYMENLAQSPEP